MIAATPPRPGRLWRVRDLATFAELRRRGRRARRGLVRVTWLPGDPGTPPRVALAVGRRAGTAVVRNRVRRRLRAAMRSLAARGALAPGAYLVGAGAAAAAAPFDEVVADLAAAVADATDRGSDSTWRASGPVGAAR